MWLAQAFTELSLWVKGLIALVGTGITAFFYKKIKIIAMAVFDKGKTLFKLDQRTEKMEEKAIEIDGKISQLQKTSEEILYQLKTNNGTSLRDSINRIEEKVNHLREKIDLSDRVGWEIMAGYSFRADSKGKVTHVSQKLLNLLGCGEEQFIDFEWLNLLTPRQNIKIKTDYRDHVDKGLNMEEDLSFLRKTDNALVHVRMKLSTVRDRNRDVVCFIAEFKTL